MSELSEILGRVDALRDELASIGPLPDHIHQKVDEKLRTDWNFHSNRLEGNRLDYGETVALLLHDQSAAGKPLLDHKHVVGHNKALRELESLCKRNEPITEAEIRELHQMMLVEPYENRAITADGRPTSKRVTPGSYKTQPNHVETATGEVFRFAEPFETPAKMAELLQWYRDREEAEHPLLIASMLHYRFLRIHPFADGNGRMARFLLNYHLMRSGLPPLVVRATEKDAYLQALRQADANRMDILTAYLGERLIASLELTIKAARGESIEEGEDLDKQIALLKAELGDEKTRGSLAVSAATIQKRIGKAVLPLFRAVAAQLTKFDEFFFKSEIAVSASVPGGQPIHTNTESFDSAPWLQALGTRLEGAVLELVYSFQGLRAHRETPNFNESIRVKFYEFRYEVIWGNSRLSKFYDENLTPEEIAQIKRDVGNTLLQFVREKTGRRE